MLLGVSVSGMFLYFGGIVTGYLAVRYRLYVSDRASQVTDHLRDFEKLHEAAIGFWCTDFNSEKGEEQKVRVLSSYSVAIRIYPKIIDMSPRYATQYEDLVSEYFRACTGGAFDDPTRVADIPKALELAKLYAQITDILRQVRFDLSSLSVLITDIRSVLIRIWRLFHNTFLIP